MISPLVDKVILTPYHHDGPGSNGPVTRLVIHGTVSPTKAGGAEANAHYFQLQSAGGAAHYVVDVSESVCCVDEDQKAAHAPPNAGSIGVELCDPQTGDPARWQDPDHQAMLAKAAQLCADICARNRLPVVWLTVADLQRGGRGITSHANVAQAWRQSDHTDPGPDFPVDQFLALLTGAPTPSEDDPMIFIAEFLDFKGVRWLVEVTPRVAGQYGTRQQIPDPAHLDQLVKAGVRNIVDPIPGGNTFHEVK